MLCHCFCVCSCGFFVGCACSIVHIHLLHFLITSPHLVFHHITFFIASPHPFLSLADLIHSFTSSVFFIGLPYSSFLPHSLYMYNNVSNCSQHLSHLFTCSIIYLSIASPHVFFIVGSCVGSHLEFGIAEYNRSAVIYYINLCNSLWFVVMV